ncbi:MAG: VCBS domain-containing protein, partial [Rhizobiaceae bacterium]
MYDDKSGNPDSITNSENLSDAQQQDENLVQVAQASTDDIQPTDAADGPVAASEPVVEEFPSELTPDADNIVRLPETASVENIQVDGDDLILRQADGSLITIKNAALNIPTFYLGDVEIPSGVLVAALQTNGIDVAAGPTGALSVVGDPSSSGGNFGQEVPDIGQADPILDLLPYTELRFPEPEERELFEGIEEDEEEEQDNPISVSATSVVAPAERAHEEGIDPTITQPPGSEESTDPATEESTAETSSPGTISIDAPDGIAVVRITAPNGNVIELTGPVNPGSPVTLVDDFGELAITSYNPSTGEITYEYTVTEAVDHPLADPSNPDDDVVLVPFTVEVEDPDGSTDSTTFNVGIGDDEPTAEPDTDVVAAGSYDPVGGNVITDDDPGDSGDGDTGADTVGADGATVTSIVPTTAGTGSVAVTTGTVVQGEYGVLTISDDGSYSYTRDAGTPGGVDDVFTYTLEDGDGDTDTTTLTISIEDSPTTIDVPEDGDAPQLGEAGTYVYEAGLPERAGGDEGSGEAADPAPDSDQSEVTSGTINYTAPDGPATITIDGVTAVVGQDYLGDHGTLKVTAITDTTVEYTYTLTENTSGDATSDNFAIVVADQDDETSSATLTIDIIDDVPTAVADFDTIVEGGTTDGNVITGADANDAGGNPDTSEA